MAFSQDNDVILIKLEGVGNPTVYVPPASDAVRGLASFDERDFIVEGGHVLLKLDIISNIEDLQANKVDKTQTIADIDLQDNITASELKTGLSLENVDNTADVEKPVSTAQAAAVTVLDASKVDKKTTTGEFVYSHNGEEEGEIEIEDTPTEESTKLVKSGGIKAALDGLDEAQTNAIAAAVADILGGETTYDTLAKIILSKGQPNGIAPLDGDQTIPSDYLPSYVDDILEYDDLTSFPATGEGGKIYLAKDTNLTYRWSGTAYVEISKSLALGITSSTAFRGDYGNSMYLLLSSLFGGSDIETLLAAKLNKADKYTAPIELDYNSTNEYWDWDYSDGDNATITMLGSEATTDINIDNATAGDIGVVTVKGGQLTLPENSILSSDFGYLAAIGNQYYRYTFYYDGTNFEWHRSVIGDE